MKTPLAAIVLMSAALAASLAVGAWLLSRIARGLPLLAPAPRRPASWGGPQVGAVLLFFVATTSAAMAAFGLGTSDSTAIDFSSAVRITAADSLSRLATVAFAVWLLRAIANASWTEIGWDTRWREDVKIGALAFVAILAPVYAIQIPLNVYLPAKHPVQTLLEDNPHSLLWAWCLFQTVIAAPLSEEFFFRLLLQGWCESIASSIAARSLQSATTVGSEPSKEVWPLLVSSLLFAGAHIATWPNPIPLFVLALGLGYLYRQTHRLLPCVVTHACFNAFSMLLMWTSLPSTA